MSSSNVATFATRSARGLFAAALVASCLAIIIASSTTASAASADTLVFYTATSGAASTTHEQGSFGSGGSGGKLGHARVLLQSTEEEVAAKRGEAIDTVKSVADDVGDSINDIVSTIRERIPSEEEAREALEGMPADLAPAPAPAITEVEADAPTVAPADEAPAPDAGADEAVLAAADAPPPAAAAGIEAGVEEPTTRRRSLLQNDYSAVSPAAELLTVETEESEYYDGMLDYGPSAAPAPAPM